MTWEGEKGRLAQRGGKTLSRGEILAWLREETPARLALLWEAADGMRREYVGDAVHLRGLLEMSNHCARRCTYCGINADRTGLTRYRMTRDEILACVRQIVALGYGTVVLQAGEDFGICTEWLADVIRAIKATTDLAVTLGLGERSRAELQAWRAAGADRYLLKFETSDSALFRRIHPPLGRQVCDRVALLKDLQAMGYETGGGIMVGIPGQGYASLVDDLALFRALDLEMVGIGPYLSHPATSLGAAEMEIRRQTPDQVPNTELMTCKVMALTRLLCPAANIPSTTALATINAALGRQHGLERGANVIMPNLTPRRYRQCYEIYPQKAETFTDPVEFDRSLRQAITALGRTVGQGPGGRPQRA